MEDNVNKCRICLRVKKSRKLVSLFDENSKNIMKIFLLTGVKADDYIDLLPNKICLKCSDSLLDAFQIRNLCIESDRLLRKQLHDLNLLADKEPKIEVTDNQHENEDFISIAQTNHQNNNQVFTKTEDDFESFPDFEPSEFLSEDFEESIETKVKKRSKAKVKESKKVILTKKYKLTDPKMFTEIKSEKPTRQPCPICGRMLTSNYLSHHIKTHSDKPEFWCDHCPLTFKIKGYLVAHLTNIHFTNISKKLVCNICSKRFAKPYLLKEHLAIHDNIRNFPCTRCDKSFFRKFQLEVHFRGHTGERPFICSYCQRGFIHFTDHKRHVMSHTGERPYKCGSCDRGFIKKSELTTHEKSHK